jgi:UDP-glucose 4-epimerase
MKRLVILGGSGFMGQNLLRLLPPGRWQTLVYDQKPPRFHQPDRYVQGDLAEVDQASELVEAGDVVIHLVHQGIPADSAQDPAAEVSSNLYPFLRLLPALARRRPALFLYSSTGGQIYGHAQSLPVSEDAPTRPISAYGVVKLAMEHYLRIFASAQALPFLIVRISNPYGPFQEETNRHGAVPAIMRALLLDRPFIRYGRGDTVRDYIHVDDVISALLKLIEAGARDQVFNLGTGQGTSLNELIARIEDISGKKLKLKQEAIRSTDVLMNVLDAARLRQAAGWEPRINLDFGLSLTWEYLKRHAHR